VSNGTKVDISRVNCVGRQLGRLAQKRGGEIQRVEMEIERLAGVTAIEKYQPAQWPVFLYGACGEDGVLRARVEELLARIVRMTAFWTTKRQRLIVALKKPAAPSLACSNCCKRLAKLALAWSNVFPSCRLAPARSTEGLAARDCPPHSFLFLLTQGMIDSSDPIAQSGDGPRASDTPLFPPCQLYKLPKRQYFVPKARVCQNLCSHSLSSGSRSLLYAKFLLPFILICLSGLCLQSQLVHAAERPNIILLLADDLGWTGLSCFGSDLYETPNLDALAERGVRFTSAYSACTVCSPTRASLMTGRYPARLHLTDFIAGQNRPFAKLKIPNWTKQLNAEEITVAEVLKDAGYRTGHIGKWHLNGRGAAARGTYPIDQGFDYSYARPANSQGYLLPEETESGSKYLTDALTDKACEFIDQSAGKPFFLYFAYNVPHTPIEGRQDLVDYFQNKVDAGAIHQNPIYAAMVASLDMSVGRIVDQLKRNALTDQTLIVFISDNGGLTQRYGKHDGFTDNIPLRRGKGSAFEGGVRVPAIIFWPGVTQANSVCHEPIITNDLFPTCLAAAGVESQDVESSDGRSLQPLLQDVTVKLDRDLFWHYPHYHAGGDSPYSAIRSGDFRLIEFHEDDSIQLYNLAEDIGEQRDVSLHLPDKTRELRSKLHRWRDEVNAQMPTPNPNYDESRAIQVKPDRIP
jgi:arylsulfatase A